MAEEIPSSAKHQTAVAMDGSTVQQAMGNIYNYGDAPGGPGLTSVSVPLGRLTRRTRGRDALVDVVAEAVREPDGRNVVLHGAGGYGKTTVALRIVERVADEVDVWWVDASTTTGLVEGLREVALRCGADQAMVRDAWSYERGSAPDLLWRSLNTLDRKWLLVLDNADDAAVLAPEDGRVRGGRGWLRDPEPGRGTILVTTRTRDPGVWGRAERHAVTALSASDGADVLLDRVPEAGTADEAVALATRLGGLPLALWLAGSYLASTRSAPALPGWTPATTFAAYLQAWNDSFVDVTDLSWTTEAPLDRELLTRTWELSLDLLDRRGHVDARPLLRALSWLGPTAIPLDLLDAEAFAGAVVLDGVVPAGLGKSLRVLAELGLLDEADNPGPDQAEAVPAVVLHPVIRDANRYHVGLTPDVPAYTRLVLDLVHRCAVRRPYDDLTNWPVWRLLLPHCSVARGVVLDQDQEVEDRLRAATVCDHGGDFSGSIGLDRNAFDLLRAAVEGRNDLLGPGAVETLGSRFSLASALRQLGRLAEAEAEYRTVLAGSGDSGPYALNSRFGLADILRVRGDIEPAEREFRLVLAAHEETHPDSYLAVSMRNGLARVLCARGGFAEAEGLVRRSVDFLRRDLGAEHHLTAVTVHVLATILLDRGGFAEAEQLCAEVIRLAVARWGERHPFVIQASSTLGRARQALGDLEDAERVLGTSLASARQIWGDRHPGTLMVRQAWANVLASSGRLAEAEAEYRSIVAVEEALHGAGVRQTATAKHGLAIVVHWLGDLVEAERLFREAIKAAGPDEVESLGARCNLANLLVDQGDLAAAEIELRSAVTALTSHHGYDHPETLTGRYSLAQVLRARGDLGEAGQLVRQVLEVRRLLFGDDHPSVLSAWHGFCLVLGDEGDVERAEWEYRNLTRSAVRVLGPKHPDTLAALNSLAVLLRDGKELVESEAIFRSVLSGLESVYGADHARTIGARFNLGCVLHLKGDVEAAVDEFRTVLEVLGDAHRLTGELGTPATFMLAAGLQATGRIEEAEALTRQVMGG